MASNHGQESPLEIDACWHHVTTPTFDMDMPNGSSTLGLGFAIFKLDQEGEAFILFDFNC
jgi:hypothetical protein